MTIRASIELAKRGVHVLHIVGSRSAARRIEQQLGPLNFDGGGRVEVVSIDDMPKPGREFSSPVVIDEIRHMTPRAYEYLASKIDAKREPAGHAAGSPQASADRPEDPPLDDNADDGRSR